MLMLSYEMEHNLTFAGMEEVLKYHTERIHFKLNITIWRTNVQLLPSILMQVLRVNVLILQKNWPKYKTSDSIISLKDVYKQ